MRQNFNDVQHAFESFTENQRSKEHELATDSDDQLERREDYLLNTVEGLEILAEDPLILNHLLGMSEIGMRVVRKLHNIQSKEIEKLGLSVSYMVRLEPILKAVEIYARKQAESDITGN